MVTFIVIYVKIGRRGCFFMREIVSDERVCRQTEGVNLSQ